MSRQARLVLDPAFPVGSVDPRLFGSFVEHVGRCVYTGIYEPGHPAADADGLRTDVLDLIRELGVTVIRYPGGNFVSGYDWEDGIGPADQRPVRRDPRGGPSRPTSSASASSCRSSARSGAEPMLAVNLGTRGMAEGRPAAWSTPTIRVAPRAPTCAPATAARIPTASACGAWGTRWTAPGRSATSPRTTTAALPPQTAWAMRLTDPDIQLVACGSSSHVMPTFGAWEATVLGHAYDMVDYISMHAYYEERDGDRDSFLASAVDMEAYIGSVAAICDYTAARLKSPKKIGISFDEWNVWYSSRTLGQPVREWTTAPRLLEDVYSVTDAVVVGSLLIALLRHADRVRVACLAQLVNAIAPIMTEPGGAAWRQATFYPFALTSRYGRGTVLAAEPESPAIRTAGHGDVPAVHATAVMHDEDGSVTVFAVNRDRTAPVELLLEFRGMHPTTVLEHRAIADPDEDACNTAEQPDCVTPAALSSVVMADGSARIVLPPMSWNIVRFA